MKIKIFDVENGVVIYNEHCLLIPELKAIIDNYKNPLPALAYLYYRYDPQSPYGNVPEIDKEEVILKDFPGEYTLEDEIMLNACAKMELLYTTPTYRYYLDNKILMEKLGRFARTAEVETGRDGNYSAMLSQIKSVGKTMIEFKQLEDIAQQEIQQSSIRGGRNMAYDG